MSRSFTLFAIALLATTPPLPADDAASVEPKAATPAAEQPADAAQTVIHVSKETTRITEPLTEEGYVDYLEATNARFSTGVTAENNFEVVVRRVLGPADIEESMRGEYHRRLGIETPPVEGDYYRSVHEFVDHANLSPDDQQAFDAEYDVVLQQPWKGADHPRFIEWLKSVEGHLDAVAAGTRRSHCYVPYLVPAAVGEDEEAMPRMIGVLLPSVQSQRELTRGLKLRAMNRLGEGDIAGAWGDLQAIHRQARHVDNGATIIEALVGIALDATAFHGDALVLQSDELTPQQALQCLADLKGLTPIAPMAEKIDVGERFMGLDAVQTFAVHGMKSLDQLAGGGNGDSGMWGTMLGAMIKGSGLGVDYNETMVLMNGWYDELVDAVGESDRAERARKFEILDTRLQELSEEARDSVGTARKLLLSGQPNKVMGRTLGNVLVSLLLPAVQQAFSAELRANAYREVTQVGFALRAYHAEQGRTPRTLAELAPRYVASIPADPQTGKPLVYRVADGEVLVYGLGQNGEDDKGIGYSDRPEGDQESDDIAVRFRTK